MQEFVKVSEGELKEVDRAKLRNYEDLDAVTLAIQNGELKEGDLFSTICQVSAIEDDIALEVYRIKSYIPDGTTAANSLVNLEMMDAVTDSKIDEIKMNDVILPKSTTLVSDWAITTGDSDTIGYGANGNRKKISELYSVPLEWCEYAMKNSIRNGDLCFNTDTGEIIGWDYDAWGYQYYVTGTTPFIRDGNTITISNYNSWSRPDTCQEVFDKWQAWRECSAVVVLNSSGSSKAPGYATVERSANLVDLGEIATADEVHARVTCDDYNTFVSNTTDNFTNVNARIDRRVTCTDYNSFTSSTNTSITTLNTCTSNLSSGKVDCSTYNSKMNSLDSSISSHGSSISSLSSSVSSLNSCTSTLSSCIDDLKNRVTALENSRWSNSNFSLSGTVLTMSSC